MKQANAERIAINVMRARLTVIGFNIAIVSFQLSELFNMSGGVSVPGFSHAIHFRADMALFLSLALSLISLIVFLCSSALDEVGNCDHRFFIVGDLLMYLALANTVTGFFSPLNATFLQMAQVLPEQALLIKMCSDMIFYLGCVVWLSAIYWGPAISLKRSSFSHKVTFQLALVYLVLLMVMFWVTHQVLLFENASNEGGLPLSIHYWYEFFQPITW